MKGCSAFPVFGMDANESQISHLSDWQKDKKTKDTNYWQECGATATLMFYGWDCQLLEPL